jgi:hypothetical protein
MNAATDRARIHRAPRVFINTPILVPMTDEEWQDAILKAVFVIQVGKNGEHDEAA